MPANAGIQVRSEFGLKEPWIPVCTGMTEIGVDFESTNSEPLGFKPRVVQLRSNPTTFAGFFVQTV